jgi:hypothetical protein
MRTIKHCWKVLKETNGNISHILAQKTWYKDIPTTQSDLKEQSIMLIKGTKIMIIKITWERKASLKD